MRSDIDWDGATDAQLVVLSLEDQDNFHHLIKRYESKLLQYIRRATDIDLSASEDLLQEIFIKVYRNLNSFNQKLKFSSWIYRIARNEMINQYRKRKAYNAKFVLDLDESSGILTEFISGALDVEEALMSREDVSKVRTALAELPDKYRDVLLLRYFEDKNYNEISDILQKPPGTIATLLKRAKFDFVKIARRHQLESLV